MDCSEPDRLRYTPGLATLSESLAIALQHHRAGRLDVAEEIYRRILAVEPEHPDAQHLMGVIAHQHGDHETCVQYVQRAVRADGRRAMFHNTLGEAYRAMGRMADAVACYQQALSIEPDRAEFCSNLGLALHGLGRVDEAIACYQRALAIQPHLPGAHNNLGLAYDDQGMLEEAIACYRHALRLKPDFEEAHANYLYALRYHPTLPPATLRAAHDEYNHRFAAPLRGTWRPHENPREPERPLRLGFVSPAFCLGPLGSFLIRPLENLARERSPVFCYSTGRVADSMTSRFQAVGAGWRDACQMSDEQLAAAIRADRIDILFDLAGYAAGDRLRLFARKPAPVQITWIDSVGTTGLASMDYVLADHYLVPHGFDSDYVERVLRMPNGYVCYEPPGNAPPVGPLPAAERECVTFGSFSRPVKIHPQVVEVWARILRRLPESRLVLKHRNFDSSGTSHRYSDLFAAQGIDPKRVDWEGFTPRTEYFDRYNKIDIMLDPFPHSGGLTTCDSLWMGVPVITCPGETFASRQSLSHLSNVGLTETIATDFDEYVELAVGLARDLPRLAQIRAGLREQMARSPLCDGRQFAEDLLALLRDVWRRWCNHPNEAEHPR